MGIRLLMGVAASLSGLRSLNLASNKLGHEYLNHAMHSWLPSLTGLTYLSMARTDVDDNELAVLAPFMSSLTHLDLNGCANITLLPKSYKSYRPPLEASSLEGLTRLNLSSTKVGDEGMKTTACLAALTHLELDRTAVTE
jgi:hypothetical protein